VTYSVAAPNTAAPTLRGGYDAINQLLLQALGSLGVPASLASPEGRALPPGLAPCFEAPSAGELVVGGEKLVGSAQHRDATAFLQHGSILLDDDQHLLRDLAIVPLPAAPPAATLHRWRPDADVEMVAQALLAALHGSATGEIVVCDDTVLPRAPVAAAATRYRDPRWTWRR
jgi:lipoate-protein ligase A